jgi:serine O-acetyltransferase
MIKKVPDDVLDFLRSPDSNRFKADLIRLIHTRGWKRAASFNELLRYFRILFPASPELRTLTDYRMRMSGRFAKGYQLLPELPRRGELHIVTPDIGPGFYIAHGNGSWVNAAAIGAHCLVNQNVTLGADGKTGAPTIGNRVMIRTGAIVVGKVTIGDDAVIGANAVVNFDVPPRARVYAARSVIVMPKDVPKDMVGEIIVAD